MSLTRNRSLVARLWVVLLVNGAVLSSWAPRIPAVKHLLGLSDSELGLALFGVAATQGGATWGSPSPAAPAGAVPTGIAGVSECAEATRASGRRAA
jgi:hypothetical protein